MSRAVCAVRGEPLARDAPRLPEPARDASGPSRAWDRNGPPRRRSSTRRRGASARLARIHEPGQRSAIPGTRVRASGLLPDDRPGARHHDDVAAGALTKVSYAVVTATLTACPVRP